MKQEIRQLLAHIRKPYRLAGGEVGAQRPDWENSRVRVCLAFPEAYELGMSNIGLAILYDILAARPGTAVERVYAPWADVETELRARDIKLFSLESQHALHEFDVVGVALPYELTYTNVLNMLELGGIPLLSSERDESHPLVIAGGPCAFNPEPIAEVFDAIVIGDGEEAIVGIADAVKANKEKGASKDELLERLATIRGVYVPSYYCHSEAFGCHSRESGNPGTSTPGSPIQALGDDKQGIKKSIVANLDSTPFPKEPLIPHAATQDRAAVEVQRGCVRGCRFCQAGMTYRPVRQRLPETVCDLAHAQLTNSGHDSLSLVSLSVGDYACLDGVLAAMNEHQARVTLPSLRVESLTSSVLAQLGKGRAGSFTLAPEAATERMRLIINKGNTDDDLYASVEKVFQNGWSKIKLYFMVGLPGETQEEIEGIEKVANRCVDIGRKYHKRPDVTVATSTFVPKPHTPLQWAGQISIDETVEIQRKLKRTLRKPGVYYRWHDAQMSLLECATSRGGREMLPVIMHAYRNGARFDGWDDCLKMDVWHAAFEEQGIDIDSYRAAHERDDRFPWDHLFVDLKKEFLWREYERALNAETTPNCIDGPCQNCGVCDFSAIKNRTYSSTLVQKYSSTKDEEISRVPEYKSTRVRLCFSKLGGTAYLGHLELADALRRTVKRARVPVVYTQGYRPHPKIDLGRALPVGIESTCEFIDVTIQGECNTRELCEVLNAASPEGIVFTEAQMLEEGAPSVEESVVAATYEIGLGDHAGAKEAIAAFERKDQVISNVIRKGKTREIDVKGCVSNLAIREDNVLSVTLSCGAPTVKVVEALATILGVAEDDIRGFRIKKVGVHFNEAGGRKQEA